MLTTGLIADSVKAVLIRSPWREQSPSLTIGAALFVAGHQQSPPDYEDSQAQRDPQLVHVTRNRLLGGVQVSCLAGGVQTNARFLGTTAPPRQLPAWPHVGHRNRTRKLVEGIYVPKTIGDNGFHGTPTCDE